MAKGFIKSLYNSSRWCKIVLLLTVIIIYIWGYDRASNAVEGFIQRNKFVMKEGPAIYDSFYANIYDDLIMDKVKDEYEVGAIINTTRPTRESLILDIGSGTGEHVAAFESKGIKAVGLDESPAMVTLAKKKYPDLEFSVGNALDVMIYPAHTFTHITCLYFTLYYIKKKYLFFRNCYEWLKPGGYLIIHLVNRDLFDPILNVADPLSMISAQKYAKSRLTTSLVKFNNFQYKGQFILDKPNDLAAFEETFADNNNKVRKHVHRLYMPTSKKILNLAKEAGFVVEGKIDLAAVQYQYQNLYILYKPD